MPKTVRPRCDLDLGTERSNHPIDAVALKSAESLVGVVEVDEERPWLFAAELQPCLESRDCPRR
jgi:hypothetical protein